MTIKTIKNILKGIALIIGIYIIYALITGAVIFYIHEPETTNYTEERDLERFFGGYESEDRVALIEGRIESKASRINMIENAEETLDITNFKITDGTAANIFYSTVVEAADRGVKVRLLFDGIFHNLRGEEKDIVYAFAHHPNIELKYFEPMDLLRPWTLHNRMHDKLILVDESLAMISGRNIGDRYYAPEGYEGATNDRDAVVVNPGATAHEDSAIHEMKSYFEYVWNHDFSQYPVNELNRRQKEAAENQITQLREELEAFHRSNEELFHEELDWIEKSLPAKKVSFIHNPTGRLNKEPWVWHDITRLMENAEESIFIQSPFIVPSDRVMEHLDQDKINARKVEILTNSLAASPNMPAFSGYSKYREDIAASEADLYEFQGPDVSIHAKSYIFDERISVIGSFNLDPRSVFISTESMIVVDSEEVAGELRKHVDTLMTEESLLVREDGSYVESSKVEEEEVATSKKIRKKVYSVFTRLVEHFL